MPVLTFGTAIAIHQFKTNASLNSEVTTLLWTIFVILLIAWLLGLVGVYQIGSIVWLLLVAALVVLVLQLISGRRTVV